MKNINFYYLIKSMLYFTSSLFKKQKFDVVFVYLNHFNRGKNDENDFLTPMIESCRKNKIKYIVFEDTDLKGAFSQYKRSQKAIPLDFITLLRIFLRKIYKTRFNTLNSYNDYHMREQKITHILKNTLFRNFQFDICINMAGDTIDLFRGLGSKSMICEYQHGIALDGQDSYMTNGIPAKNRVVNNVTSLVYGKGFQSLLIKRDKTGFYNQENLIDIGTNLMSKKLYSQKLKENNKNILFSLQITPDLSIEDNTEYIGIVQSIIQQNAYYLEKNNYKIILKQHPRFDAKKCRNIELNYSFMEFSDDTPLDDLLDKSNLHLTFHSTTAFDAALKGIPTIFIDMKKNFTPYEIFFNQYKYPMRNLRIVENLDFQNILQLLESSMQYEESCLSAYNWARSYYQDYDEDKFINLIAKAKE